jgi:hypothetical protein
MNEISDERLDILIQLAEAPNTAYVTIPNAMALELLRAYQHHKRVLPLHQAIAELCKKLGY